MPDKDPTNWALGTWILALSMAVGGGLINWYAKLKRGHARAFNFVELFGGFARRRLLAMMLSNSGAVVTLVSYTPGPIDLL